MDEKHLKSELIGDDLLPWVANDVNTKVNFGQLMALENPSGEGDQGVVFLQHLVTLATSMPYFTQVGYKRRRVIVAFDATLLQLPPLL